MKCWKRRKAARSQSASSNKEQSHERVGTAEQMTYCIVFILTSYCTRAQQHSTRSKPCGITTQSNALRRYLADPLATVSQTANHLRKSFLFRICLPFSEGFFSRLAVRRETHWSRARRSGPFRCFGEQLRCRELLNCEQKRPIVSGLLITLSAPRR